MSRPRVQQRWYNRRATRPSRPSHRQQQRSGRRNREFRPKQRDGSGYKGRSDTRSGERDGLALRCEASDIIAGTQDAAPPNGISQV
jgi:hypothetical protein